MTTSSEHVRSPFCPVMTINSLLPLLTTTIMLLVYWQSNEWQYLALAALAGVIGVAGAAAWELAQSPDRFERRCRLVMAAKMIGLLVVPFFVADVWIVGLVLLAAIPFEIGIVSQPRHIPLFTLVTLFGAALLVGIDLWTPSDRLTILTTRPNVGLWVVALAVLYFVSMPVLLWQTRLRAGASQAIRLNLTTQLALVFIGISALSILIVAGVLIVQIRQAQIQQVGDNFQTAAEVTAERVGNLLDTQISALSAISFREPALVERLLAANAAYPDQPEAIQRFLQNQAARWQSAGATSDLVLQVQGGPAILAVSAFRAQNQLHNNLLFTDREGGLAIAQGDKPTQFDYRDEEWWQTAWNHSQGDIFLGHLNTDPQTNRSTILIALRVTNPKTNEPIGVLASTYDLQAIQQVLADQASSRKVMLITEDGALIDEPNEALADQPVWQSLLGTQMLASAFDPTKPPSAWLLGADSRDQAMVVAYASLTNTSQVNLNPIRRLGSRVVVSDTQANALAEVTRSTKVASLVALLTMAGVLLLALVTARLITRPIEALTTTAGAIKEGDLTVHAQPAGSIELVTLAQTFNSMTEQLQKAFSTLQASEAKYRSLFEDSNDAIFITTPGGKLVDMNPAGLSLFGVSADELEALNVQDLYVNPDDRARFRQEIEQNAAVTDFEIHMRKRDGSHFDALITATLRHAEDGIFVGYQGIIRDITVQKQNERLQAENMRLSTELEVTQRLQRMILPKPQELQAIEGLEIAGYMEPADEVGGDYYDVLHHNGHVKIGIGDVTGHGLESGVLMLMTQMGVRTLLTHDESNPVQFMDVLNRTLYYNVQRMGIDKSLTLALLDYQPQPEGGGHLWASGQHEELIVVRQASEMTWEIERIDTLDLGFPVGLDADIADFIGRRQVALQPGDGVVLYTDGITEAENAANEQYGLERLCETIRQHWAAPAEAIKNAVIDDVRHFIGEQTVFDDITLLVLKQR